MLSPCREDAEISPFSPLHKKYQSYDLEEYDVEDSDGNDLPDCFSTPFQERLEMAGIAIRSHQISPFDVGEMTNQLIA